jgi:SAM-dependent methyltransferase
MTPRPARTMEPTAREPVYETRAGTPMIGPYSINQMDDFYQALATGHVRPSGIMNYLQRLYIAERCPPGAVVLDVCCGRGLQLPVLFRYAPDIAGYIGLDIAREHIAQAWERVSALEATYGHQSFRVEFLNIDVAAPWPPNVRGDVAIYTSALEHLPADAAVASLRQVAAALPAGGQLLLSTPNTVGTPPRPLQHGVHVHEWSDAELRPVLTDVGFRVDEVVGLLPPPPKIVEAALAEQYGPGAAAWYAQLVQSVPAPFLDSISAAAIPDVAVELLYSCTREDR